MIFLTYIFEIFPSKRFQKGLIRDVSVLVLRGSGNSWSWVDWVNMQREGDAESLAGLIAAWQDSAKLSQSPPRGRHALSLEI